MYVYRVTFLFFLCFFFFFFFFFESEMTRYKKYMYAKKKLNYKVECSYLKKKKKKQQKNIVVKNKSVT